MRSPGPCLSPQGAAARRDGAAAPSGPRRPVQAPQPYPGPAAPERGLCRPRHPWLRWGEKPVFGPCRKFLSKCVSLTSLPSAQ